MLSKAVHETNLEGLTLVSRGKVRDIYDLGDTLLIVVTDRISAFDVVMRTPIPDKGKILNQVAAFWFDLFKDVTEHHVISTDVTEFPDVCRPHRDVLSGRTMWVKKALPLPAECIVRGYLVGSGWKDYQQSGKLCGIALPGGLRQAEKLPQPLFTPSTKASEGAHDENIPFEQMQELVGADVAERVRGLSIQIYGKAADYARDRGIILADTKFEFGLLDGRLILIDEVLTPDSSRFWPADRYQVGTSPESFDKQYLRDYLLDSGWSKDDPAPELPDDVVENTRNRYLEALRRLTGKELAD
jgi:phosphoribosylaminoimidazole-succinocarboxamide synthase